MRNDGKHLDDAGGFALNQGHTEPDPLPVTKPWVTFEFNGKPVDLNQEAYEQLLHDGGLCCCGETLTCLACRAQEYHLQVGEITKAYDDLPVTPWQIYRSKDGWPLSFCGEVVGTVVCVSLAPEWDRLHMLNVDGKVGSIPFSLLEPWHKDMGFDLSDGVPHPAAVASFCDAQDYALCLRAQEFILARWIVKASKMNSGEVVKLVESLTRLAGKMQTPPPTAG